MTSNSKLKAAAVAKQDEFYTEISTIENELVCYQDFFRDKVVYCNCDDPKSSKFVKYFLTNFARFGLKKLVATCYKSEVADLFSQHDPEGYPIIAEYNGSGRDGRVPGFADMSVSRLKSNGDFRSEQCVNVLKQSDVVVTNPPFSLFRDFITLLMKHDKKFLILGHVSALSYTEVFPYIANRRIWLGHSIVNGDRWFRISDDYPIISERYQMNDKCDRFVGVSVRWFTNIEYGKPYKLLELQESYTPEKYLTFDNYDAINIDKTKNIPADYDGAMGVPITFLDKWNPNQFEIVDANSIRSHHGVPYKPHGLIKDKEATVEGESKYTRVVIRKK